MKWVYREDLDEWQTSKFRVKHRRIISDIDSWAIFRINETEPICVVKKLKNAKRIVGLITYG